MNLGMFIIQKFSHEKHIFIIPFIWNVSNGQIYRNTGRLVVSKTEGEGRSGELLLIGIKLLWSDDNDLEVVAMVQQLWMHYKALMVCF